MHTFKFSLVLASVLAGSAFGCNSGADELVKAAEAFETATCACKDIDCTTKASQDYAKATTDLASKNLTPTEAQVKRIGEVSTKAAGCVSTIAMRAANGN